VVLTTGEIDLNADGGGYIVPQTIACIGINIGVVPLAQGCLHDPNISPIYKPLM